MSTLLSPFGSNQNIPDPIETCFNKFLTRIRTTPGESAAAASHRKSIQTALESSFSMSGFFRTGSFGSGTNIAGQSDVDYFAVIPTNKLKQNSFATLEDVASVLRDRFPLTGVRVKGPSVQVPFGPDGAETTEIVPVDFTGFTKLGFRQFDMPDGNGGWMFTAPESHKGYVDWVDAKHFGRVKPLIRFLKAWNFKRNVGVKSFFLELWATKHASEEGSIVYDVDIAALFGKLITSCLSDLPDPRFPNDNFVIPSCNTEFQRVEAIKKVFAAHAWARQAIEMRHNGKAVDSSRRWDLVFNHDFPAPSGAL